MSFSLDLYVRAVRFAALAHGAQKMPGLEVPYIAHPCQVAAEIILALQQESHDSPDLAVTCALLHDVVEDTAVGLEVIEKEFGAAIAKGVSALTKDPALPKDRQMKDSLARIVVQPHEIWMVKLADRASNLDQPPHYWTEEKCRAYRVEAETILEILGAASPVLSARLEERMRDYRRFEV